MYGNLIEWICSNGGYIHPNLYVHSRELNGTAYSGVYCHSAIESNKKIAITNIPHKVSISEDTFYQIPNIDKLTTLIDTNINYLKLSIALLYETLKEEDSFHHPHIKTLPKYDTFYTHPIYISYKENSSFDCLIPLNSEFNKVMRSKVNNLNSLIKNIMIAHKNVNIFSATIEDNALKEMIIWSFLILSTRSWSSGKLIPFNDLFNHNSSSNIMLEVNTNNEKSYIYMADKQCKKSDVNNYEVFAQYGHYAMLSFIMYYNFLPLDRVNFLRVDFSLKSDDSFEKLKIDLIKKSKYRIKRVLLSNDGASRDFFQILRILSLTPKEYNLYMRKKDKYKYRDTISYENELRAIRLLINKLLDLKKSTYTLKIMNYTDRLINQLENKSSLSSCETVIRNVCIVKVKEYEIIEDSLSWANDRLLKVINSFDTLL